MPYIVSVTKRYTVPASIVCDATRPSYVQDMKVFEQEFDDLNLSRFVTDLNRPVRGRKPKASPTQS